MNALYVIFGLGFLSLIAEIVNLKKGLTIAIIIGILAAVVLIGMDWNTNQSFYNEMVTFDNAAISFTALILVISIFWFWMAGDYFSDQPHQTDRSALILFSLSGALIMVSFSNMAMLFLGIEVLSISLYVLAGSNKNSLLSNEASFKYFLMGSFATGFLLMGIALIYGATGSFNIQKIAVSVMEQPALPGFFYVGIILMLVGMAFKISAVPFHFWAPDVYEGSPITITAFMSTVVKIAAIAAFYKLFTIFYQVPETSWRPLGIILQAITVLTLIVPNVTAVFQTNVKRLLAYSSVGNVGYILLAFISGGNRGEVVFYYLTAYSLASIAAFTVLYKIEKSGNGTFKGLFKRNPLMALLMTVALLSLAGIPPLAGFLAKYLVFVQALEADHSGLVIIAIITSLTGVFYYFRVLISMFQDSGDASVVNDSFSSKLLMIILLALIIGIGLFPDFLTMLMAA
ncbi:MAG: NADH-quinone oxidoreductase subunit N [Cyclobacteriaceae bacterium]|nr:NADH-quinone oxidoreductase subunit N [Cyclobacteriaceae bacterium]